MLAFFPATELDFVIFNRKRKMKYAKKQKKSWEKE